MRRRRQPCGHLAYPNELKCPVCGAKTVNRPNTAKEAGQALFMFSVVFVVGFVGGIYFAVQLHSPIGFLIGFGVAGVLGWALYQGFGT